MMDILAALDLRAKEAKTLVANQEHLVFQVAKANVDSQAFLEVLEDLVQKARKAILAYLATEDFLACLVYPVSKAWAATMVNPDSLEEKDRMESLDRPEILVPLD